MGFVVNKIDYAALGENEFVSQMGGVGSFLSALHKKNIKINELSSILIDYEKDAVVLEEYTGDKNSGRYFVFVEYRKHEDQQLRGRVGDGNMMLSTMGPLEFIGNQQLPDLNIPGSGPITMDMGPGAKYINFSGRFMFDRPEESAAWLEDMKDSGAVFIFHYKNWHRYVKIARFNYKVGEDTNHISYSIGLKNLSNSPDDIQEVIRERKKSTRLEEFSMAELVGRLLLAASDGMFAISGLNDQLDKIEGYSDLVNRYSKLASAAMSGLANSGEVLSKNNILSRTAKAIEDNAVSLASFGSDIAKANSAMESSIQKMGNDISKKMAGG